MTKDLNKLFNEIIILISIDGKSLRDAIKGKMSSATFYELIKDKNKSKLYARACEERADLMADEILEISDNIGGDLIKLSDGREVVDNAVINRDRLRVDTRKWLLAKLQPKKYGDKIETEHSGNVNLKVNYGRKRPVI
jgi:hypothetical protein